MEDKDKKVITMELVVKGLKFIAEHQTMTREELKNGLLALGCDFKIEDIQEQFPEAAKLYEGMNKGEIAAGASVIANMRDNDFGMAYGHNHFLSVDDETSVYHFIRVVTGDNTYTRASLAPKEEQVSNPVATKSITMELVIKGLKFIAEHQSITREELEAGLIELGCDFTVKDILEQFPEEIGLFKGMAKGHIACGASVIANMRDSEYGKAYGEDRFLRVDDETSVYHFIRVVTGDNSYTKENIDALSNGTGGKRI